MPRGPIACAMCSVAFTPLHRSMRYCSDDCKNEMRLDQEHKARKRGAPFERINRLEVFAASGWRCAICDRQTPATKIGSGADDEPTLDHVLPFARGGHHVISNVQLLCRFCNSTKQDSIETDSLRHSLRTRSHLRLFARSLTPQSAAALIEGIESDAPIDLGFGCLPGLEKVWAESSNSGVPEKKSHPQNPNSEAAVLRF